MGRYHITFECDPMTSNAPWSGRESAEAKMKQSLKDYLVQRCGASNVEVKETGAELPEVAQLKKAFGKK
jgi:hypothetical protein